MILSTTSRLRFTLPVLATVALLLPAFEAHADSGDEICFPLYRQAGAVPGTEMQCKLTASTAPVDMGTFWCTGEPPRIDRYCGTVIKPPPPPPPPEPEPPSCDGGGPSSSTDVGNPIDSSTGNKHQTELDYRGMGLFPLVFERYYNSLSAFDSGAALGMAWRFTYDRRVRTGTGIAYVSRPDGRIIYYTANGSGWAASADVKDRLVAVADASGQANGWQWTNATDGSVELYDANGRLSRISARNGQAHTLMRSTASTPSSIAPGPGYLIRVTDHFGRLLNFTWNSNGTLATFSDPHGNVYRYGYDDRNRLTSVEYPAAGDARPKRAYLYNEATHTGGADADNLLTGIIDERGVRLATYDYDAKGRGIGTQYAGGAHQYKIEYGASKAVITDALGSVRTYRFSKVLGALRLAGIDQPAGSGCPAAANELRYDGSGNVVSRKNFNGVTTTYGYEPGRNLQTVRTEAAGTPQARMITTAWHPVYPLPARIAASGRLTTFSYFDNGDLRTKTVQATDDPTGAKGFAAQTVGAARVWGYTYNSAGQILSVTGPRTDLADTTSYAYDNASGNLVTITDALGHVTRLRDYDLHGHVGTIAQPNGVIQSLAYTPRGWLARSSETAAGTTRTTRYDYDDTGLLKRVTLPDGSALAYVYDDAGRLMGIADTLGNAIRYQLDGIGNRTSETVADASGNLVRKVTRAYDELNRMKMITGGLQ